MLIMKIEWKKGHSFMKVTENATSHFLGGQDFIPANFILSSCSYHSDWVTGEEQVPWEGALRLLGLSLNKLTSRGVLEGRSLSDANSKLVLLSGFRCQLQGEFQELSCFPPGNTQLPSFSKTYLPSALKLQLVPFSWITPSPPANTAKEKEN